MKFYDEDWKDNSSDVKDLLRGIFRTDPAMRLTAAQIISHPVREDTYLPLIRSDPFRSASAAFLFFPRFFEEKKKVRELKSAGMFAVAVADDVSVGGGRDLHQHARRQAHR